MTTPTLFAAAFEIALKRVGRSYESMTPVDTFVGNMAERADRAVRLAADGAASLAKDLLAHAEALRLGEIPSSNPASSSQVEWVARHTNEARMLTEQLGELFVGHFGLNLAKLHAEAAAAAADRASPDRR